MKILPLSIFIFCICTIQVTAQPSFTVSDKSGAAKIKETILAVVVKEKDEKRIQKLSKDPEELKAYETGIEAFNRFIKEAMQKEWNLSKEVVYVSEAEAEKIKDEKNPAYSFLEIAEVKNYKMGDFYSANPNYSALNSLSWANHITPAGRSTALTIVNATNPGKEIIISYLPAAGISSGSVTCMILNLKNQLTNCLDRNITSLGDLKKDIEKREAALKNKTLLLFDPLISKGLQKTIDKKEVGKFYDYKYEVTSFERADKLIAEKNKDYAYVWVVPAGAANAGQPIFNYFIINAEDGHLLYLTGRAVAGANGEFHPVQLQMVNKEIK